MSFISCKSINGKNKYYLEKSLRLQEGKIKKYSVYLKNYTPNNRIKLDKYEEVLKNKITKDLIENAVNSFQKNNIFDKDIIKLIEEIKINYQEIVKKLNDKQLQDVIDRFTINFTYESNALEGNSLTLKDVAMILDEKFLTRGRPLRDVYEAINTRKAIELIFKNKFNINEKDIIKLHKILVSNTGIPNGYKTLPNFLLDKNVKTTSPENVHKEIKKLLNWYENDNKHTLEKAAIFHGKFEEIHPFEDGNGRVGRLLINIMLLKNNYPPIIIRKTQRESYFHALEAFDNNYSDKLRRFFLEKYKVTYENFFKIYIKYLK